MRLRITPNKLAGSICVPSSKSMGHREIICAALAEGISIVDNISFSADIEATCRALKSLGTEIVKVPSAFAGRCALQIKGGHLQVKEAIIDCGESGSTLRFLIPLGAICGAKLTFTGRGKLVTRPLQAYYDIFTKQNLKFQTEAQGALPLTLEGKLVAGEYLLPGNVSSQFISGLLFTLPLLAGDSVLRITSPLESQSYVALTLACLEKYGICVEHEDYLVYKIKGGQKYHNRNSVVEGDYSQAAFWLVAGALGQKITCRGITPDSLQGDKKIIEIMQRMGCGLDFGTGEEQVLVSQPQITKATTIDASDCPDIIPVLSVLAAVSSGTTHIIKAGRLRIKECDRLLAMTTELNKIGAEITELPEGLIIKGKPNLTGGQVSCWNDHRIAMSLAIASQKCTEPLLLEGTECVAKSYPDFWEDFKILGGIVQELKVE